MENAVRLRKCGLLILLTVLFLSPLGAETVVATNTWTADLARMAGADEVVVLAPSGLRHPPEYEITLKQLQTLAGADFLIYAGYEKMMKRIRESLGEDDGPRLVQVMTVNNFQNIQASVMEIARLLDTEEEARLNLMELELFLDLWKRELLGQTALKNCAVHFHQQGPARGLGLQPAIVFGPASPTLQEISTVLKKQPGIIIDNYHNSVAEVFLEQENPPEIVLWLNFPGLEGTETILDVLKYNKDALMDVLR